MNVITLSPVGGVWADAGASPVFTVDFDWPVIIGLVVSVVLPLLVGLVTKTVTHPGVKAVLLAIFSAVTGLLTELGNALAAGEPYNIGMGIVMAILSFAVAVSSHYGIMKPTGASAAAQRALGGEPKRVVPVPSSDEPPAVG